MLLKVKEVSLKQLQDFIPKHWLIIAAGGTGTYVAFLAGLKGALPDLSRNELLGLYSAITGLLVVCLTVVICWIAIPREPPIGPKTKREFARILIAWIVSGLAGIVLFLMLMSPSPLPYVWDRLCSIVLSPSIVVKVDREDGTSRLVSGGQSVVVRPGERVTLTVGLDPLPNLCRDYSFLSTSRFGDVRTLSSYELEYIAPKHEPVDYIVVYANNQRTGQRLEQPFNVVIQDQE